MQQHVLDDGVGALAVLDDFLQIVLQHAGQFVDLLAQFVADRDLLEDIVQFVGQLRRERGKIVDEIERVLDLVRDAGGELAERGELLGLHQPVLRGAQFVERLRQLPGPRLDLIEQTDILDGDYGLVRERVNKIDLLLGEQLDNTSRQEQCADGISFAQEWNAKHGAKPPASLALDNGESGSARISGTCTVWRSRAALPVTDPRSRSSGCASMYSLNWGGKPWVATR